MLIAHAHRLLMGWATQLGRDRASLSLTRGSMPLQVKANGLLLCDIPPELSGLNSLELRLICLRVQW